MSRRAAVAALVVLAACGGPQGTNSAAGTAKGVTFDHPEQGVYAVYNIKGNYIVQDSLVIVISNDPDACSNLEYPENSEQPFLKNPIDGSHAPTIWIKTTTHSDILTTMRGVGDDLYARFDPGAPADSTCAQAACDGKWIVASKGSLEIDASSNPDSPDAWAAGSYYLTFQGEQLSGTFHATPCKSMKIGGCSAAGGSAIPALGLLALALAKRRKRA